MPPALRTSEAMEYIVAVFSSVGSGNWPWAYILPNLVLSSTCMQQSLSISFRNLVYVCLGERPGLCIWQVTIRKSDLAIAERFLLDARSGFQKICLAPAVSSASSKGRSNGLYLLPANHKPRYGLALHWVLRWEKLPNPWCQCMEDLRWDPGSSSPLQPDAHLRLPCIHHSAHVIGHSTLKYPTEIVSGADQDLSKFGLRSKANILTKTFLVLKYFARALLRRELAKFKSRRHSTAWPFQHINIWCAPSSTNSTDSLMPMISLKGFKVWNI